MAQASAHKRRRAPDPKQAIAIALSDAARGARASHNWRHAMSTRARTIIRRLFVAAGLALPFLAGSAFSQEPLRSVRELNATSPRPPKLTRLLAKVRRNRGLVDEGVKARKLTAAEGSRFLRDLTAIEKRARALARRKWSLTDETAKSLDSELDEIGRRIRT
jgi:hypothetical protein